MIKKITGVLFAAAVIALIVVTVMHRGEYRSAISVSGGTPEGAAADIAASSHAVMPLSSAEASVDAEAADSVAERNDSLGSAVLR